MRKNIASWMSKWLTAFVVVLALLMGTLPAHAVAACKVKKVVAVTQKAGTSQSSCKKKTTKSSTKCGKQSVKKSGSRASDKKSEATAKKTKGCSIVLQLGNGTCANTVPADASSVPEQIDRQPVSEIDQSSSSLNVAEQITALVNEQRAKAGVSPVTLDAKLTGAANIRAKEIEQSFAHTRPDGRSFSTVFADQGISYRGCGENIAWGQRSAEEVMNGWMNSEGHRANILNSSFKNIGVGYYQDAKGINHWVQLFSY